MPEHIFKRSAIQAVLIEEFAHGWLISLYLEHRQDSIALQSFKSESEALDFMKKIESKLNQDDNKKTVQL